jgi:hypothetical protein
LTGSAVAGQQQQPPRDPNPPPPAASPTPQPTANGPAQPGGGEAKPQGTETAAVAPGKQFAEDSAKLLKMATDLKAEVDKTNKDTLSLSVIRKADEIERLARSVREKAKLKAAN